MPKRGIHPYPHVLRVVMSNGATLSLPTAIKRSTTYFANVVRTPTHSITAHTLNRTSPTTQRGLARTAPWLQRGRSPSSWQSLVASFQRLHRQRKSNSHHNIVIT